MKVSSILLLFLSSSTIVSAFGVNAPRTLATPSTGSTAAAVALKKKPGADALLERLRAFRGRLPADFHFDRDESNTR